MLTQSTDLEPVTYGAGVALLRAELDTAITDADQVEQLLDRHHLGHDRAEPDEALYTITQSGRDYLARERAMAALFGRPWPTVAEVMVAALPAECPHGYVGPCEPIRCGEVA